LQAYKPSVCGDARGRLGFEATGDTFKGTASPFEDFPRRISFHTMKPLYLAHEGCNL
jgi:hypothetical protein